MNTKPFFCHALSSMYSVVACLPREVGPMTFHIPNCLSSFQACPIHMNYAENEENYIIATYNVCMRVAKSKYRVYACVACYGTSSIATSLREPFN